MIGALRGSFKMPRRIITAPPPVCVCVCDANEAGRAVACPRLISVLRGAVRMSGEVKWGVINLNEVQLFSHLLIIAG